MTTLAPQKLIEGKWLGQFFVFLLKIENGKSIVKNQQLLKSGRKISLWVGSLRRVFVLYSRSQRQRHYFQCRSGTTTRIEKNCQSDNLLAVRDGERKREK